MITQFDVFNKMPKESIDIFMHIGGGKQLSKKNGGGAIIEMLVDNDTFQNFAFQQTYGEPKSGKKEKFFIMYAVDREEYEKQLALLNSDMQKNGASQEKPNSSTDDGSIKTLETFRKLNDKCNELQRENEQLSSTNEAKEKELEYWKQLAYAAEEVIMVMDVPKNRPDTENYPFLKFGERNQKWQQLKQRVIEGL